MIQLVVSGAIPRNPLLKRWCLRNPDVLLQLGERAHLSNSDVGERFSLVLHDLRISGTWKRTNRKRLRRTEDMLCAHIVPQLRQDLLFLDVGASDGITTVDALCRLREVFGEGVRAYAADLNLWLLRYRRGPIVEYRASDGEPIMARLGPFGLRVAKPRRGMKADLLARFYLHFQRFRRAMWLDTAISLVNPLARGQPDLTMMELDCLRHDASLLSRISAVRVSNVLNLGYFDLEQISEAVGNFHAYLRDGGCLVISRNTDRPLGETEDGSVWIKEPARFRWVEDFGAGADVKNLVDSWQSEPVIDRYRAPATT